MRIRIVITSSASKNLPFCPILIDAATPSFNGLCNMQVIKPETSALYLTLNISGDNGTCTCSTVVTTPASRR
jgi:hypothetical protein